MKYWSVSTTLRNPDRIPDFAKAIESVVGQQWNEGAQLEFMYELIRRRLYKPTTLTDTQSDLIENPEHQITTNEAKAIFDQQGYEDPPLRGRTAMAPLRDMGLVKLSPEVELTELGVSISNDTVTLQDILINYNLKWEIPTPSHRTYKPGEGWNTRPFIATLALIQRVNKLWLEIANDSVGISRDEFNYYVPTLIDFNYIDEFAKRIVSSRVKVRAAKGAGPKLAIFNEAIQSHLTTLPHGDGAVTPKDMSNLRDYGDNTIRYFRKTGLIEYRGAGRYVDISKASRAQVDLLIENELYKPVGYAEVEDYRSAVSDLASFKPPWAVPEKMAKVKSYLKALLAEEGQVALPAVEAPAHKLHVLKGEDAEIIQLKDQILKSKLAKLKAASREEEFVVSVIGEYGALMKKDYGGYLPKPVALEFNTYKAFLSINDAIEVRPNYPVGDDGEPISTAPGGGTDMICEYEDFMLSVEVTMSMGRGQWVMEGQPVQRHLRDIELDHEKEAFGLFIAPKLHLDTVNTFWIANVHGYQGKMQKIIPLEFEAWKWFLESVKSKIIAGTLKKDHLLVLLNAALPAPIDMGDSVAWQSRINSPAFAATVAKDLQ